ncbi:hypothetical protein CB1_000820015, partial [Camelus ferus]
EYEDKTEGITKEVFLQNLAHFSGLLVKSHSPSCQEESLIPGRGPQARAGLTGPNNPRRPAVVMGAGLRSPMSLVLGPCAPGCTCPAKGRVSRHGKDHSPTRTAQICEGSRIPEPPPLPDTRVSCNEGWPLGDTEERPSSATVDGHPSGDQNQFPVTVDVCFVVSTPDKSPCACQDPDSYLNSDQVFQGTRMGGVVCPVLPCDTRSQEVRFFQDRAASLVAR